MSEQLIEAAKSGDVERVEQALAAGADVDSRDAAGATALMFAAHGGHLDAVQALIAAGKPPKVAITAIMRKLAILANALLRQHRAWMPKTA